MKTIVGVRFKTAGKVYYFDPAEYIFKLGDHCIVETSRGVECGDVVIANRQVSDEEVTAPLKKVIRPATDEDMQRVEENRQKEKKAFNVCQERIRRQKLEMALVDVEYTFDRSKILFYFTAEGRVDFRDLVKELAGVFKTRIELRQIGVRDESKILGGLGICGREFCCHGFLGDFHPVNIKMAKEQGLSPNPLKISGPCGRLMCCLGFEQSAYESYWQETPAPGSFVKTPDGEGVVADAYVLKGELKVKFIKGEDISFKVFPVSDVTLLRAAKKDKKEAPVTKNPKNSKKN
ncbi:MAG: stage 0 sporulation family protein [Clostridia bacterium]|nr:stage 0 sporulation family protein [Clostridia bacterium]